MELIPRIVSEVENVTMVKESTGNIQHMHRLHLLSDGQVAFYNGCNPIALEALVARPIGRRMSLHYEDGITDKLLSPQPSRSLEILHSRFPPGTYSEESYSHEGEEAGYVLSGEFELWVGERHFLLSEGDSFAFSSQEPHRYGNPGERDALVIWIITPPTF